MQRKSYLLVAAMLMTMAAVAAAQSGDIQNQPAQPTDGTVNQQSTTPAQTPSTPADQQTIPADQSTTTSTELPKTASPLPLVGLGGLASLAMGAWMTRTRRRA